MNETPSPTQWVITRFDLYQSDRWKLVSQLVFICISFMSVVEHFFHKFKIHVYFLFFQFIFFAYVLIKLLVFHSFTLGISLIHFCVRHSSLLGAEADYVVNGGFESGMDRLPWWWKWVHFLGYGHCCLWGCGVPEASGLRCHPWECSIRAGSSLTQAESKCVEQHNTGVLNNARGWSGFGDGCEWYWGSQGWEEEWGMSIWGTECLAFKQIHRKEACQLHWKFSNMWYPRSQEK